VNKVYIEYSGTAFTTDLANKTKELIESQLDVDVELMVGEPITPKDGITLLNENFNKIIVLTGPIEKDQLRFLYL
jgi:heptaprenylglyceryl phosphate synthase